MKLSRLIAIALILVLETAHAQWSVFDPINWISNYSSAASALLNEANTMQMRTNQLQQLLNEARQLKQMGAAGFAARELDIQNELLALKKLKDTSVWLSKSIDKNTDFVTGLQKMIYASNMTADVWLQRERKLVGQKNANAVYLMKQAQSNVEVIEAAQRQREKVLAENNYDEGIRAVTMKTNVLLGNMATVQSQMLAQMTADSNVKASQIAIDTAKEQKEKEDREFVKKRIKVQEQEGSVFK